MSTLLLGGLESACEEILGSKERMLPLSEDSHPPAQETRLGTLGLATDQAPDQRQDWDVCSRSQVMGLGDKPHSNLP